MRARQHGYALIEGRWEELPDASYDVGYSHHCLEHLRDPIGALYQWGRIIRPGGKLFLAVPGFMQQILASHITTGWSISQLAYNCAVAGFDCRQGRFKRESGTIYAIVDRPDVMEIANTDVKGWGVALDRMPAALGIDGNGATVRPMKELNW